MNGNQACAPALLTGHLPDLLPSEIGQTGAGLLETTTPRRLAMRSIVSALLLMATLSGLSRAGEMPFDPVRYEAMRNSGMPFDVVFHADWCPTCRAQAPVLKELTQLPEFMGVTLFVANFDTEKVLERSLGISKQSTSWCSKMARKRRGQLAIRSTTL
jgi:thiol-disulfide isomerase/thioredoxin